MSVDRNTGNEDALVLIQLRSQFYRKKYHLVLGVCFLGLFMIAALIGMLIHVVKHPPYPLYFVTDNAGRFIQEIPVQQPNMSTQEVAAWVVEAVETAYSYDFVNYHLELQSAQKYFTDYGWKSYMNALEASNNLIALNQRKQIVTAKVVSPPKLLIEGPLGKAAIYAWKFEMPVLVNYMTPPYNNVPGKSSTQNALVVTVLVMRQSMLLSDKGLGIVQLISTLATTSTPQNLAPPS